MFLYGEELLAIGDQQLSCTVWNEDESERLAVRVGILASADTESHYRILWLYITIRITQYILYII